MTTDDFSKENIIEYGLNGQVEKTTGRIISDLTFIVVSCEQDSYFYNLNSSLCAEYLDCL